MFWYKKKKKNKIIIKIHAPDERVLYYVIVQVYLG